MLHYVQHEFTVTSILAISTRLVGSNIHEGVSTSGSGVYPRISAPRISTADKTVIIVGEFDSCKPLCIPLGWICSKCECWVRAWNLCMETPRSHTRKKIFCTFLHSVISPIALAWLHTSRIWWKEMEVVPFLTMSTFTAVYYSAFFLVLKTAPH